MPEDHTHWTRQDDDLPLAVACHCHGRALERVNVLAGTGAKENATESLAAQRRSSCDAIRGEMLSL